MDRLDMAIALIEEAKAEKSRLKTMEAEIEALSEDDREYWTKRYRIVNKHSPTPHKSLVNDNLKMARRILAGEYM